jgi:mRNA interferase RelE/StbE
MTFKVIYSRTADQNLSHLPDDIRSRIILAIRRIRDNPFPHIHRLHTQKTEYPLYKMRVGQYRVILQIIQDVLVIYVVDVGHRKNVYRQI